MIWNSRGAFRQITRPNRYLPITWPHTSFLDVSQRELANTVVAGFVAH